MLLQKERERLLAILQSRTASHEDRKRARRTLEGELSPRDWSGELPGSWDDSPAPTSPESERVVPHARQP
jgi:hypothetical protein